jgi:ketosteroid isomerase-like protein
VSDGGERERIEHAVTVVTGYLDALNRGDYDEVVRLTSDDFEIVPVITGKPIDRDQYLAVHTEADKAFGDLRRHIESIEGRLADDGAAIEVEVVVRVTATNDREIDIPTLGVGPLPPTGLELSPPPHHDFFEVRDGLIRTYRSELPEGGGFKGMIATIEAELDKREREGAS